MNIVLASGSPRRKQLLNELGINDLLILPAINEEIPPAGLSPQDTVAAISLQKAMDSAKRCPPDSLVIAADTLVYLDNVPLGKPVDEQDAKHMLEALSGREHIVTTGVSVIFGERVLSESETTLVHFRSLTPGEIAWYVKTGEPMDKAGAYGIQGKGSIFIDRIEGDFFNVMGLPMCRLLSMLRSLGITLSDLGL